MTRTNAAAHDSSQAPPALLYPLVAVASWLVPGLGHLLIGQRARAIVFFTAITLTFWGGVAIGGVRSTVDPDHRRMWFMAQVCAGGQSLVALAWAKRFNLEPDRYSPYRAVWPADDVAVVYTGVAGLLNLLVLLDALSRLDAAEAKSMARRRDGSHGGPPG